MSFPSLPDNPDDPEAIQQFVWRFSPLIAKVARQVVMDVKLSPLSVELTIGEIHIEAVTIAVKKYSTFVGTAYQFPNWLRTITFRVARRAVQKRAKEPNNVPLDERSVAGDYDVYEEFVLRSALHAGMEQLSVESPDLVELLRLRYLEGLSLREIAASPGYAYSLGHIRRLLGTARRELRKLMEEE